MRTARGRLGAGGGEPRGRPALSWALTMAMRVVRVSCRHTMGARGCWGRGSVRVNRVRESGRSEGFLWAARMRSRRGRLPIGPQRPFGRECATLAVPLLFGDGWTAQLASMCVPCTAGTSIDSPRRVYTPTGARAPRPPPALPRVPPSDHTVLALIWSQPVRHGALSIAGAQNQVWPCCLRPLGAHRAAQCAGGERLQQWRVRLPAPGTLAASGGGGGSGVLAACSLRCCGERNVP